MRRIIFSLVIMVAMMPIIIDASECSNEDKERLQNLANNVSVILEEQENDKFSAIFSDVSTQLRIFNPNNWLYYRNITGNEIDLSTNSIITKIIPIDTVLTLLKS